MGAEHSLLEDCEWEVPTTDGSWSLTHGRLPDGTEISRFRVAKKDKRHEDLLRRLTKNLKSVRHPSILTYVCSEEDSDGGELVTERAVPLESVLQSLSCSEICAGLHTVLDALHFLHENVCASHNNINIGSVYVTSDGSWRLGGLEHLCKFSEATDTFLGSCKAYRHESTVTPEEKDGKVSTDPALGHARDVYAFAVMTEPLLEQMEDLGDLTKTFELRIQDECLHRDPRNRPKVKSLMSDRLFNTDFLEIALFLKNITLKTEEERLSFFRNLVPRLHKQAEELVARRLVSGLLTRFVFLDQSAVEYVLPSLLTPKSEENSTAETPSGSVQPLLSEPHYKQHVVPKLVKIFSVHDYHIHILLLQYFPHYVHLIDKEDLELDVFPQVLLGLRDCSEVIASLSLHALAEMVPVLGRDVVIGGKSKQYFKEGRPKIQTQDALPTVNNKQSNLHGVMGKMKLVDIAKQSDKYNPAKEKSDDTDLRKKERELKREEMKKKRKERRQRKEDTELARQNSETVSREVLYSTDTHAESPESSHEKPLNFDGDDCSHVEDYTNNSPKSDRSETKADCVEDDADEAEKSHWSGWSEDDIDTDYSDEIERELQNMSKEPDTLVSSSVQQDYLKSSKLSKGRAMKLVSNKHSDKQNSESIIDEKNEELEVEKNTIINSRRNIPVSSKKKLGSEFDIMNLDIKVSTEEEVDFFADMAPKIEAKTDAGNLTTSLYPSTDEMSSKEVQKKFVMEVQDTEVVDNDVGAGWGDDDW